MLCAWSTINKHIHLTGVILHLPDGGHAYAAHLVIKAIIVMITVKATVCKRHKDPGQERHSSLTRTVSDALKLTHSTPSAMCKIK